MAFQTGFDSCFFFLSFGFIYVSRLPPPPLTPFLYHSVQPDEEISQEGSLYQGRF